MAEAKSMLGVVPSILLGKKKKKKIDTAPTPDDAKQRVKRERDAQAKYANSGRVGTILSKDTLG